MTSRKRKATDDPTAEANNITGPERGPKKIKTGRKHLAPVQPSRQTPKSLPRITINNGYTPSVNEVPENTDDQLEQHNDAAEDVKPEVAPPAKNATKAEVDAHRMEQIGWCILTRDNNKPDPYGARSTEYGKIPYSEIRVRYHQRYGKWISAQMIQKNCTNKVWHANNPSYPKEIEYAIKPVTKKVKKSAAPRAESSGQNSEDIATMRQRMEKIKALLSHAHDEEDKDEEDKDEEDKNEEDKNEEDKNEEDKNEEDKEELSSSKSVWGNDWQGPLHPGWNNPDIYCPPRATVKAADMINYFKVDAIDFGIYPRPSTLTQDDEEPGCNGIRSVVSSGGPSTYRQAESQDSEESEAEDAADSDGEGSEDTDEDDSEDSDEEDSEDWDEED
jgi:hypothetical protein